MKNVVAGIILLVISCGIYLSWEVFIFLYRPFGAGVGVVVAVKPGDSFSTVARRLHESKVVDDVFKLKLLARVTGQAEKMRVGEYKFPDGVTPLEVLETLSSGRSLEYKFTVQEGLNRYEIAELYERMKLGTKQEFLNLTEDKKLIKRLLGKKLPSLEGYLFPETYLVTRFTGGEKLIEMMVNRFLEVYPKAVKGKKVRMSRHQLLILASIIEKETGAPEERAKISSVFHNRLRKQMRLQTDPTILYGILDQTKVMKKNITRRDIETANRYNTYTFAGLPYGPISNPGEDALRATAIPEKTDYLYFVSRNDGTSQFSKTLKEHNKAVRKYQLNRANRVGKSWRDLKKRSKNNRAQAN